MKEIQLTNGGVALVDDADYPELSKYRWYGCQITPTKRYAGRYEAQKRTRGRTVLMHRHLMQPDKGKVVDHLDHDGLNNQRNNLRVCGRGENSIRRARKNSNNTTGYTGVQHYKGQFYRATIQAATGTRHLGVFVDPAEAARAYDRAALEIYGEFARLNFSQIEGSAS